MIKGVGTDILQLSRARAALSRTPKLAARVLTPSELALYEKATDAPRFFAKRFAAKEAVVKALGCGIGRGVSWQHLDIIKTPEGQPSVQLSGGAAQRAALLKVTAVHLSYSDEQEYVVAFAIAVSD